MKSLLTVFIGFLASISINAAEYHEWVKVQFDPDVPQIRLLVQGGTIEAAHSDADQGWMLAEDYRRYSAYFNLERLASEIREVRPLDISFSPDTLGEVLATYPLPPQVESVRGLGYDGEYFYIADADINDEKIHKLDPNNNFAVVKTFPSPGVGSFLPWGVTFDGNNLYIADGLQDLVFKLDTSGTVISNFPTGGPLATGLGYRTNELWNADIGSFPTIPPRVYKSDTLGTPLANYTIPNTINGVACNDSAIFVGRNINNGHDIRAMNPLNFVQLYSFPSPLDYPNGLAFDGTYLWICGLISGQRYIVQVDLGREPEPPQSINAPAFELVDDGYFNNRFSADFDSEGNVHLAYATQFETVSSTKEIMYATNKSGVWELTQLTHDVLMDELPVIDVDANDMVHMMWNGFVPQEGDVELFYTNNGDSGGAFFPKIQVTSLAVDGVDGHTWPTLAAQDNGMVHFAFVSTPVIGTPELYYGNYFQGTTSTPVNISNNTNFDSDPRILLDSLDNPHVFWRQSSLGLNHATNASGNWMAEFITQMGSSRPGAAIDDQGILHFIVTQSEIVKYGNNAGGSFSVIDTIAVHTENCFYPDMAVDESGGIHVTYHSFGDSVNSWPARGEIFYSNDTWWSAGKFPQNVSQLETEQEIYPGLAVKSADEILMGWARTGSNDGIFSNIRMATTLPDSGGLLTGRIYTLDESHHFGYIEPLDSAFWTFEIYNRGTRSLTVSNIEWESSANPPFVVTTDFSGPQIINFRDTIIVTVKAFIDAPVRMDTSLFDGLLTITSDDPLEPLKEILLEVESEIVGIEDGNPALITENKLYPNFPNPFNPTTHIGFQIADFGFVSLKVYDITGREVATLVSEKLVSGGYEYKWDAQGFASGIYFYRLNINDKFAQAKQMVLLK